MRFNTLVDLYEVKIVNDGQGGRVEDKIFYKSLYCHLSLLSLEKQIQIFGVANYESLNLVTMDSIDIDNFIVLINGYFYKATGKLKKVKNKTYVTLEMLENAN